MADPEPPAPPLANRPRRRLWLAVKAVLVAAVVAAVAWQFASILGQPGFWSHALRLHPAWLAVAAVLYFAGNTFPACFWYLLLRSLGQRPAIGATVRAFYVGQLARYVPGKIVGLGVRARLLAGPGVRPGVAVLTVVYESLTTLASGVLLGLLGPALSSSGRGEWGWRAAALLSVIGVLLLPAVFNRLAERAARPFRAPEAPRLPPVRARTLALGLAVTACGWLVQGGAVWAVVEALTPGAWPSAAEGWLRCAAYGGLAYAAGYLMFAAPGGIGVRDYVLQQCLAADLSRTLSPVEAEGAAVIAALAIRLLWVAVDAAGAAACYGLPVGKSAGRGEGKAADAEGE